MWKEKNPEEDHKNYFKTLDKRQRWAVLGLSFFSVLVVVFWTLQVRSDIRSPFNTPPPGYEDLNEKEKAELSLNDLITKDTDGDGLSDYEELNVYKTSPYLEDSDGDGFSDAEEITMSTDPLCPAGQVCRTEIVVGTSTSELGGLEVGEEVSPEDLAWEKILTGQGDPALLRKVLLESGLSPEILDNISDEDLWASYEETLNKD